MFQLRLAKRILILVSEMCLAQVEGNALPPERIADINRARGPTAVGPADRPERRAHLGAGERRAGPLHPGQGCGRPVHGPMAERLRRSSSTNCALIFVDTSRPGARQWSSMGRCGNRAKARAFRDRKRKEENHG
jgi:hypothetical protein